MKIWAVKKGQCCEYEIGVDIGDASLDESLDALYRMARNLFVGKVDKFWERGEEGEAFKPVSPSCRR